VPAFAPVDFEAAAVYVALGVVVLLATIRRPSNAVAALIATAPFDYAHALGSTTITFGKVSLVAALLGLALRRPRLDLFAFGAPRALLLALFAVLAATALSVAVAYDRGAALRETLKAFEYLLIFVVAAIAWAQDTDQDRFRSAVTLTVCAVAILALVQELIGAPSGIFFGAKAYPRIAGPLEGPNQLAAYLGIALPFLLVWSLERATLLQLASIALDVAALILTLSRAGVVCAIVASIVVLALYPRRERILATCGAIAGGIAGAACVLIGWHVSGAGERFFSFAESDRAGGVGKRSILWNAALKLWRRHPILGVGAGNFQLLLPAVGVRNIRTHANSWYLQSLVEGGLPLLASTLALVWFSIAPFTRLRRNGICLAALAASIGFALHGFVDLLVFYPKVGITWVTLLGVAAASAEAQR
jgi:O-antigen ligase